MGFYFVCFFFFYSDILFFFFFFFSSRRRHTRYWRDGVQTCALPISLAKLFPGGPRLHSSSRTDTGVHALGMVAHVEIRKDGFKMPLRKLALALNAWLPEDIRVVSATRCRPDFHARFDATGKQYRYFVWNQAAMNPLLRHRAWHVPKP